MIHDIGWMALTMGALLIKEAGSLVRRQLAYRQQRWIVENVKQTISKGQSVEITGLDQISITPDLGRRRTRRDGTGSKRLA
jgi:hypothetical protein